MERNVKKSHPNKDCPYCGEKFAYFTDKVSWRNAELFQVNENGNYDVIVKCRRCHKNVGIKITKSFVA